ncbi:MAG: four helix bundle suffix domain-containing protein [Candidatus Daviesbacteria bacterium]|nr:four helix bundle suffix domain-containing protein [Candidatus Daviesbacteria bacterium]
MNKVKYLLTYRYSEIIHDLTVEFTKKYVLGSLSNLGHRPDYRTADQMNQAARSGKQNIVEGVGQAQTSKKGEIKLLGVAKASFEELLTDCEDFLRQNNLEVYPKNDPRVTTFRQIAFRLSNLRNLSDLGNLIEKPKLPENHQDAANFLLTLCHQVTFLLDRQIKSLEERFIKEGGFSENLFKKRLEIK